MRHSKAEFSRGTSLIGKSVRDFFRSKVFIRIFDGFFFKTKGFLPKVYEIFGSELPLENFRLQGDPFFMNSMRTYDPV